MWTWGRNGYGATGHGVNTAAVLTPEAVAGLSQVSQVSFGPEDGPQALNAGAFLLTLGAVSTSVDYTCTDIGRVMSQHPLAFSVVSPGTSVAVTVGTAPPPPHQCR